MDNILGNGTVLPFGLLSEDQKGVLAGFAKTHQNFALRVGIVTASYPASNSKNKSKLCTEYDVTVIEQNEDRGMTSIPYRNCLSAEGLGSIADFFEKALRPVKKKNGKGPLDTSNQDGAIVLLLCLDGMSEKGIIMGALTHPTRNTTLLDEGPRLEGEYNGINIKVEKDGSTMLTFRGATDNNGNPIDSSQGNTVIKIEKDGSYQVSHKSITQRFDKGGDATLTADGNISNVTKKNYQVNASQDVQVNATGNANVTAQDIAMEASGSATIRCQSGTIEAESGFVMKGASISAEAEGLAKFKASQIVLDGLVALGGEGGQPVLTLITQFIGIGNLGLPVISTPISGYAAKVTAQ